MVPLMALVLGLVLAAERPAAAAVLDFEGLDSTCDASNAPTGTVPLGYGGLNWTQYSASFNLAIDVGVECDANYQSPSFYDNSYGAPSPSYAAFSVFGELDASKPVGTFNFFGGYFSSFAMSDAYVGPPFSALSLAVQGYKPGDAIGSPTYSDAFDLSPTAYNPYVASWTGLNMLVFLTGDQLVADQPVFGTDLSFLMDNLNITDHAERVPEPASMFLLGAGVLGLAARARKRRSQGIETV
jgi:hypothetical protein